MIEAFETAVGTIVEGWPVGRPDQGVQIVETRPPGSPDLRAFTTLGLGRHALGLQDGREGRMELTTALFDDIDPAPLKGFLAMTAELLLEKHEAPLRGDIFDPRRSIYPDGRTVCVYVTAPVFLAPEHQILRDESGRDVVLAWLLPITMEEAALCRSRGWESLEDHLEMVGDGIFDPLRRSIPGRR